MVSPENSMSDLSFSDYSAVTNTPPSTASFKVMASFDEKIAVDHSRRGVKRRLSEQPLPANRRNAGGIDGILAALSTFRSNNNDSQRQRTGVNIPDLVPMTFSAQNNSDSNLRLTPEPFRATFSSSRQGLPSLPNLRREDFGISSGRKV
jgi:hypothetical protein